MPIETAWAPPEVADQSESTWRPIEADSGPVAAPKAPAQPKVDWQAAYQGLDGLDDNQRAQRIKATNQAYVFSKRPTDSLDNIARNWDTYKASIAHTEFGLPRTAMSDDAFQKALIEHEESGMGPAIMAARGFSTNNPVARFGQMYAWVSRYGPETAVSEAEKTLGNDSSFGGTPLVGANKVEAKKQSPAIFQGLMTVSPALAAMYLHDPEIINGVYNAVAPRASAMTSPKQLSLLGGAAELKALGEIYPAAKIIFASMSGGFAGLMGKAVAEGNENAQRISADPKSTKADKIEAWTGVIVDFAMMLGGAFGAAHEVMPSAEQAHLAKIAKGAPPETIVPILRKMADRADPIDAQMIHAAADELEKIAPPPLPKNSKGPAPIEPQPIIQKGLPAEGDRPVVPDMVTYTLTNDIEGHPAGSTVHEETLKAAGYEVPAHAETVDIGKRPNEAEQATLNERMVAEQKRLIEEHLGKTEPTGTSSIKNASVEAFREKHQLPPLMQHEILSDQMAADYAQKAIVSDPLAGSKMIDRMEKGYSPTKNEVAVANIEVTRLENQVKDLSDALDKAKPSEIQAVQNAFDSALDEYTRVTDITKKSGTQAAQALQGRAMELARDFSLAEMTRKATEATGHKLTKEEFDAVKELQVQHAKLQKQYDNYRSRMSELLMSDEPGRKPGRGAPPGKVMAFISEQAKAARARILDRATRASVGIDPTHLADLAIIGAEHIAKGVKEFGEWSTVMLKEFGETIKPHLKDIFEQAKTAREDASRLQAYKTRTNNRIAELEKKTAENDFAKKERVPLHKDEEANLLQAKKERVEQEYYDKLAKWEYEKKGAVAKFSHQALNVYDAARAIKTTGEFSFILRQGLTAAASHPLMVAKTLPDAFRSFAGTPEKAHAINLKVLNHPDLPLAEKTGVHILKPGQSLTAREETFAARMIGKIPVVHRFEQMATTFLNSVRFDLWQKMRAGSTQDKVVLDQISKYVNESTGRGGLGKLEQAAVPLARLLFSPRFLMSRIQYAMGHSLWDGTIESRKIIAKEYARTMVGLAAYYAAQSIYFEATADKKENQPKIGTDKTSSDFGKIIIGNTRLDPMAGFAQVLVFMSRSALGRSTDLKGKATAAPLGGDQWARTAIRFARSKAHPLVGSGINLIAGKDIAGNQTDILQETAGFLYPTTYTDVYDVFKAQNIPDASILSLMGMLGEGLQTYSINNKAQTSYMDRLGIPKSIPRLRGETSGMRDPYAPYRK